MLGAGILGSCTALELADRGERVCLFERNADPISEASLYNEGKIHLGFVYAADPTFRTAERMIWGAVRFMDVLARWIPSRTLSVLSTRPFDYVVHRETMVPIPDIEAHFRRVGMAIDQLIPSKTEAVALDPSRPTWRRLSGAELAQRYDPGVILAAYETCELAIDTLGLAEPIRAAVRSHPNIDLITHARVVTVKDRSGGCFEVHFESEGRSQAESFAGVVNALWTNRPHLDRKYGLPPEKPCYIRHKLGVNLNMDPVPSEIPCFTVSLGPFGDAVVYPSGRVYLSWYPVCMVGTNRTGGETDWDVVLGQVDQEQIQRETVEAMTRICPAIGTCGLGRSTRTSVNGGSIFAPGQSDIDDRQSELHERLDYGFHGRGTFLSVDTSKFTLGPAMAIKAADHLTALLGRRT